MISWPWRPGTSRLRRLFFCVWTLVAVSLATGVTQAQSVPGAQVNIVEPTDGEVVADIIRVVVEVSSTEPIDSVTVELNGHIASLTFNPNWFPRPAHLGDLSVAGVPSGPWTLVATAVDQAGLSSVDSVDVILDRSPVLTIDSPLNLSVGSSTVSLVTRCLDELVDGCTTTVRRSCGPQSEGPIAQHAGASEWREMVDLSALLFDDAAISFCIVGEDAHGSKTAVRFLLFVEADHHLVPVVHAPGWVVDVDEARYTFTSSSLDDGNYILLSDGEGIGGGGWSEVGMGSLDGRWRTLVGLNPGRELKFGPFLTPTGMVYVSSSEDPLDARILEWKDGEVTELGITRDAASLSIAGDYAAWRQDGRIFRREFSTETTIQINNGSFQADNNSSLGVRSDGSVYFISGGVWYSFRNGVVASDQGTNLLGDAPCTESGSPRPLRSVPCIFVGAEIAYTDSEPGVWLNNERLLTSLDARLEALGPDRTFTFTAHGRRFLSRGGEPPIDLSSDSGHSSWEENGFHVSIGRTLFVVPTNVARTPPASEPPGKPELHAYPNPARGLVHVSFTLAKTDVVSVRVFDVLGREIGLLVDGLFPAGEHLLGWESSKYAPGHFVLLLVTGSGVEVSRAIISI